MNVIVFGFYFVLLILDDCVGVGLIKVTQEAAIVKQTKKKNGSALVTAHPATCWAVLPSFP